MKRDVIKSALVWAAMLLVVWKGGGLAEDVGLPAPHLFTGLVVGLVVALTGLGRCAGVTAPAAGYTAAQAVTGVLLGTYFNSASRSALGAGWLPILIVMVATLVVSLGAGVLLARLTGLDSATAALGMVAGGSAGIVATSEALAANSRLVALMQYLRLFLMVLAAPPLIRWLTRPSATRRPASQEPVPTVAS